MALRENASRRLTLEFEAFRVSTTLVEEYYQNPDRLVSGEAVKGFGIYSPRGVSIVRQGSAPSTIAVARPFVQSFSLNRAGHTVILVRPLGAEESMGAAMQGMMRGFRSAPGNGGSPDGGGSPSGPPAEPPLAMAPDSGRRPPQPRILWLEFSLGGLERARLATLAGAALISLVVLFLYLSLVRLYRRNGELLERDAKNRELIQLGEAARTVAHEIKNPLAVIRIQSATIKRLAANDAICDRVGIIDEEVLRLSSLSDRIRDFLKSGEGEPRRVELSAFLREFASRYAPAGSRADCGEGQGVSLCAGLPPEAWALIDPSRLSQALDNLVGNALDASPAGGAVELGLQARARRWEISVSDRGPGVPHDLESRIFEPFFTTKEKGSGIGLALARKTARSASGELSYKARPGGGAVFVISLPRA
jgi:two-component system sensor histidine kinase HydH